MIHTTLHNPFQHPMIILGINMNQYIQDKWSIANQKFVIKKGNMTNSLCGNG
jgi:hypothetical protein